MILDVLTSCRALFWDSSPQTTCHILCFVMYEIAANTMSFSQLYLNQVAVLSTIVMILIRPTTSEPFLRVNFLSLPILFCDS